MITRNLEEVERQEKEIRNHIHRQILGVSDQVRSKEIWHKILTTASPETIANALSDELTHFKYHEISSAKFCCRQIRP